MLTAPGSGCVGSTNMVAVCIGIIGIALFVTGPDSPTDRYHPRCHSR